MKNLNNNLLTLTVAIIDFIYQNFPIQRFWVLETIARAPYFAFLSVLHFKESLGLRTEEHYHLMKEHFEQTVNETEHLIEMENRGGADRWHDRFIAYHLVLIYYWILVGYYFIAPKFAYHLNAGIELHATETYLNYLLDHPNDKKIAQIAVDEMNHYIELSRAMEIINA
jgi:ubiquinol oxidase